jgi:PPM family protein phosphatase
MSSFAFYVGLPGEPPLPARLGVLLRAHGQLEGDWEHGIEIGGVRLELLTHQASIEQALTGPLRGSALPIETVLVIPYGPHDTIFDVARALIAVGGGSFVAHCGDVLKQALSETDALPEAGKNLANRPLDISVPPEVEVGFGRVQTLVALAARVEPTATFARFAGTLPAQWSKLKYARPGDWGTNSIGSLVLYKVSEPDDPLSQAELAAIGLPRPAALFRLKFEHENQTSALRAEWQAMLQVLCGLARETDGILYQPPGEVWRDFASTKSEACASNALVQRSATPKILEAAAQHDTGTIRAHNEDRAAVFLTTGLCVVADGMGGQSSGDEAAETAVSTLAKCLEQPGYFRVCGPSWEQHRLVQAIKVASVRIASTSHSNNWAGVTLNSKGLGAAVAAALAVEGGVLIAHVGDARVYRLRDGALHALTTDHSLLEDYRHVLPPDTPPEQLASLQGILTRAVGMLETPKVDARFEALSPGDLFLLCTDGLHQVLTEAEIAAALRREQPLSVTCQELLQDANERGTPDNLAVVLVRWG